MTIVDTAPAAYVSQESPLKLTVSFGIFAGREAAREDVELGELGRAPGVGGRSFANARESREDIFVGICAERSRDFQTSMTSAICSISSPGLRS